MGTCSLSEEQKMLFDSYIRKELIVDSFPNYIVIETTNSCNLQCIMCPRPKMTRKVGFMDFGLFKKIIDEIEGRAEFVYLHFFGEPLLHKKLFDCIDYAAAKGMTIALSTNATFLDADIADRLISSKLDLLIISIDSMHEETYNQIRVNGDFSRTMKQVEDFLQKHSDRNPTLSVSLQLIRMGLNAADIDQFQEKWRIRSGINAVVKGLHDYANQVDGLVNQKFTHSEMQKKCCVENWRSMVIGWDGIVVPCCNDFDYKYPLGDLNVNTVYEVWNSQRMQHLRRVQIEGRQSEIELCKGCNIPDVDKQNGESLMSIFNPSMLESQSYFNKGLYLDKTKLYATREFEIYIQDRFHDVSITFGKVYLKGNKVNLNVKLYGNYLGTYQVGEHSVINLKTPEKYRGRLLRYNFSVIDGTQVVNRFMTRGVEKRCIQIISVNNTQISNALYSGDKRNKMNIMRNTFSKLLAIPTPKTNCISASENIVQNLDPYWDEDFAQTLETWGVGNAWEEIKFLISGCKGKVLDIACGTGKVMVLLDPFKHVKIYGFDISDKLIDKAKKRGLSAEHLMVSDATRMDYQDDFFDYSYSIGSLEHFTEDGIGKCIAECYRVTKFNSFHLLPVSRSGKNEGWMTTVQSFYNNSTEWWIDKFKHNYSEVIVLDSLWNDDNSVGKWFICIKS